MQQSDNIEAIAQAMTELNKALINPKNSVINPFFKKKYAPLSEILSEVRPMLAQHGLSVIQNTTTSDNSIGIQTMIMHVSGQYIKSDIMYIKSDKDTAQGQGSAITYGRRYQLSAMLSIASEDDDDGNDASKKPEQKQQPETKATPEVLKNPKGEIEIKPGDHKAILDKLGKCKNEEHLKIYYTIRDKFTWNVDELKEQDELIVKLRTEWEQDKELAKIM